MCVCRKIFGLGGYDLELTLWHNGSDEETVVESLPNKYTVNLTPAALATLYQNEKQLAPDGTLSLAIILLHLSGRFHLKPRLFQIHCFFPERCESEDNN